MFLENQSFSTYTTRHHDNCLRKVHVLLTTTTSTTVSTISHTPPWLTRTAVPIIAPFKSRLLVRLLCRTSLSQKKRALHRAFVPLRGECTKMFACSISSEYPLFYCVCVPKYCRIIGESESKCTIWLDWFIVD